MGAFAAQYLYFDQHDMTIVEVDGIYTEPYKVSQLFLTVAQRYSVIVTAKSNSKQNFAVVASMDEGMFDETVIPPGLNNNVSKLDMLEVRPLTAARLLVGLSMILRSHCQSLLLLTRHHSMILSLFLTINSRCLVL